MWQRDGAAEEMIVSSSSAVARVAAKSSVTSKTSAATRALALLRPKRRGPVVVGLAMVLVLLGLLLVTGSLLYLCHRGFRRTVQFWRGIAPLLVEFKKFQLQARVQDWDDSVQEEWKREYHRRSAPKLVHLILSLGGIYIKIGQVFSTIGQGLLPDDYVQALQPLQDGVPPRSLTEIAAIVERSTGRRLEDAFLDFDPNPLGAASIAQAHRARLVLPQDRHSNNSSSSRNREPSSVPVVVKVQYPEVATLFEADLQNLEWATRLMAPDQVPLVQALRARHQRELDFRWEAHHLTECRENLEQHASVRHRAVIPAVRNETGLCTEHVLVMDHLDGVPLSRAMELEQSRLARALGHKDAKAMRTAITQRLREHFESGAGDGSLRELGRAQIFQALGPWAAAVLRTYATVKEGVQASLGAVQQARGAVWRSVQGEPDKHPEPSPDLEHNQRYPRINVAHALKTLIQVHGLQLLRDGVYNADPHPGNVLVLPDGRLGLLDYGMIGRLSPHERATVAQVLVALGRRDPHQVARIYLAEGFRATLAGEEIRDAHLLHRLATFHVDRIDLSPITLESGERLDLRTMLESMAVQSVPEWVSQARRLCGLLMGVSAQAARPVSLAREWEALAQKVVREADGSR